MQSTATWQSNKVRPHATDWNRPENNKQRNLRDFSATCRRTKETQSVWNSIWHVFGQTWHLANRCLLPFNGVYMAIIFFLLFSFSLFSHPRFPPAVLWYVSSVHTSACVSAQLPEKGREARGEFCRHLRCVCDKRWHRILACVFLWI